MYLDDYNDQSLSYTFPSGETVFAFEFKTDKKRPQDGPTNYELTGKNADEAEVVLFSVTGGPPFASGSEIRRHRFLPPKRTFETFTLRVKKVGWMQRGAAAVKAGMKTVEGHGWVQVRDVKFYVARLHTLNLNGELS